MKIILKVKRNQQLGEEEDKNADYFVFRKVIR